MSIKYDNDFGKPLTNREVEVMKLIARGFTNSEIAAKLFIASSTTKNHIAHILDKLGARSRGDIIIYYFSGRGHHEDTKGDI